MSVAALVDALPADYASDRRSPDVARLVSALSDRLLEPGISKADVARIAELLNHPGLGRDLVADLSASLMAFTYGSKHEVTDPYGRIPHLDALVPALTAALETAASGAPKKAAGEAKESHPWTDDYHATLVTQSLAAIGSPAALKTLERKLPDLDIRSSDRTFAVVMRSAVREMPQAPLLAQLRRLVDAATAITYGATGSSFGAFDSDPSRRNVSVLLDALVYLCDERFGGTPPPELKAIAHDFIFGSTSALVLDDRNVRYGSEHVTQLTEPLGPDGATLRPLVQRAFTMREDLRVAKLLNRVGSEAQLRAFVAGRLSTSISTWSGQPEALTGTLTFLREQLGTNALTPQVRGYARRNAASEIQRLEEPADWKTDPVADLRTARALKAELALWPTA